MKYGHYIVELFDILYQMLKKDFCIHILNSLNENKEFFN